ncbi:oligosaccharide repeat unit polymerase [Halanaerobium congolense]|uniref:Oligosaccharide repeat unit polymerase n=1 Tax=Halanaerobium congolense TaxID=54121 RepID=A0A1G8R340_9FIRM|nr:O-antigen polymerase [Halanaerobium congolense]SDJ11424.1 oligosaccharide repeat unit polymerase [Halanaerobium congolense]SET66121.1 oligosaccharide repeat unit polymerase [Halanaerobium congolense]
MSYLLNIINIISIILIEGVRKREKNKFDILFFVNGYFMIYFAIIPILFQLFGRDIKEYFSYVPVWIRYINFDLVSFKYANLIIFCGYIMLILGYYFDEVINQTGSSDLTAKKKKYIHVISYKTIKKTAFLLFLISIISILGYTSHFGGPIRALVKAEQFRGHDAPFFKLRYLKYFISLILPTSIFYYILQKKSLKYKILFIISLIFSIYYLLLNAGRAPILMYLLFFVLFNLEMKKKRFGLFTLFIIFILAILFAVYGNTILLFLLEGEIRYDESNLYYKLLKFIEQLSPSFSNVLKVPEFIDIDNSYLYFKEYILWPIQILPKSNAIFEFIGIQNHSTSTKIHTEYFNSPSGMGMPVDLLTFGYYQLSFLGVMINSFLFGYVLKKIEYIFKYEDQDIILAIKIWSILFIMNLLIYFEIPVIIIGKIHYWLPILFVFVYRKKSRKIVHKKIN